MTRGEGKGPGIEWPASESSESRGESVSSSAERGACSDALVWTDTRKRILDCNRTAEHLLKDTAEKMRGRDIRSFVEGGLPRSGQSRCRLRWGKEASVYVSMVRDGRRNPTGFVYRFHPDEALSRSVVEMGHDEVLDGIIREQTLAAMVEVISKIAHDVSNPLTAIGGYAQVIMESVDDMELREELEIIQNEAKRVYTIIRNISSMVGGWWAGGRAPISMNACIESVLSLYCPRLETKDIRVETELAPDLPPVMADVRQMEIVFWNLVRNAEEAMAGPGKLAVRSSVHDGRVIVSVTDSGPGIPEAMHQGLFEPFAATKGDGGGIGLGLAICRRIVRGHGGRIRAESTDGAGATITIELPCLMIEEE